LLANLLSPLVASPVDGSPLSNNWKGDEFNFDWSEAIISQNTSPTLLDDVKFIRMVINESSARKVILSVGLTKVT
jgi:hypothetical protein